jgi:hypothetical protein
MVTRERPGTDVPVMDGRGNNLVETVLGPLAAIYRKVSGPSWTDQERRRRADIEASIRSSVSVNPYHLTHRW